MADFSAWLAENKALWTRVYDEVIAPDFEKAWKKRIEGQEKEQKTRDENHQVLLSHVSNEVIKNARLQEENCRLKKLLEKHNPNVLMGEQPNSHTAKATVSIEEYKHLTDSYNELNTRLQEMTQKLKYLERKNVAVMQKNKEMKENVRAWQSYCDRHLGKHNTRSTKKAETKFANDPTTISPTILGHDILPNPPSSPMLTALNTPQSLAPHHRSSPAPMIPLAHVTFPPPGSGYNEDLENVSTKETETAVSEKDRLKDASPLLDEKVEDPAIFNPVAGSIALNRVDCHNIGSSQTTEEEHAERIEHTAAKDVLKDEDDVPQVVSARSLKRKRDKPLAYPGSKEHGFPVEAHAKPIRVKQEVLSSPPLEGTTAQLYRKETMDLDELGPNVLLTPRRRLRRTNSIHSNVTGTLRHQRSSSAPFREPLIKNEYEAENVRLTSSENLGFEVDESLESRATSEPGHSTEVPANVLRPLDPNGQRRANAEIPNKRSKKETWEQEALNVLGESGETLPGADKKRRRPPPSLAAALYNRRVRANKGSNTSPTHSSPTRAPAKAIVGQTATPPPTMERSIYKPIQRPIPSNLSAQETAPDDHMSNTVDRRPVWSLAQPRERTRQPAVLPREAPVPLRERPLSELTFHDFKPNPAYTGGYTHAFSETVRKRSDRLCLPGCTNTACCGSTFRALASAAPPLTPSQEEALLQDYLGDAYDRFGLTQMSPDERDEVILQARTRQMAKEHGKHRQAFEGRRSPPGFWRVGFPSTQEQEEDREKAEKMQQEMIKERYLEAMRNGKFIFRDE